MSYPGSYKFIYAFFLFFLALKTQAQDIDKNPAGHNILLLDLGVQVECNDAIDDMYNANFDYAERQFRWLRKKYSWHPLPYFLMGLSQWWKILPDIDNENYDKAFLALMDSSLQKAEYVFENVSEIEGAFFLSATYGFKGRLYSERKEYRKAALAGKKSLKYLKICRGNEDFSPEILFGDALFNYYAEWIPDNYTMLRPIMALFPKGDLKLGLQQLRTVTRNAFYTRTEAMYFLMRILGTEEKDYYGALEIAKRLTESYPKNAYFHRYYTKLLYQVGRFRQVQPEALEILSRIDSSYFGYEANSGRYASFYLGQVYKNWKKNDLAKKYYEKCLYFGDISEAQDGAYYHHSLYHLGEIAKEEDDYKTALKYYEKTKKLSPRKSKIYKKAKGRIKSTKQKIREQKN